MPSSVDNRTSSILWQSTFGSDTCSAGVVLFLQAQGKILMTDVTGVCISSSPRDKACESSSTGSSAVALMFLPGETAMLLCSQMLTRCTCKRVVACTLADDTFKILDESPPAREYEIVQPSKASKEHKPGHRPHECDCAVCWVALLGKAAGLNQKVWCIPVHMSPAPPFFN